MFQIDYPFPIEELRTKELGGFEMPTGLEYHPDIVFDTVALADGTSRELCMDIIEPAPPRSIPTPLVVWVHGGGWHGGTHKDTHALKFALNGFVAASVEYRLSTKAPFPAMLHDCKAAIRFLRAHAAEYGIDAGRIGAVGGSAGAHLVCFLAATAGRSEFEGTGPCQSESSRLQAAIVCNPPCDLRRLAHWHRALGEYAGRRLKICLGIEKSAEVLRLVNCFLEQRTLNLLLGKPVGDELALLDALNPLPYFNPDMPPMLVVHGEDDPMVPFTQGVHLCDSLKAHGVPFEFLPLPGFAHSFRFRIDGSYDSGPELKQIEFFAAHL